MLSDKPTKKKRQRKPKIKADTEKASKPATNYDIEVKPIPRWIKIALVKINRDAFIRFRISKISHHQTLLPYILEFNSMDL